MRRRLYFILSLGLAVTLGWAACAYHIQPMPAPAVPVVYFSPGGGAREAIIEQIRDAEREIVLALYYFTDQGLAEALSEARQRGVTVAVLLDRSQKSGRYSQAGRLQGMGVSVIFDSRHRILHHKFMVVDGRTLITGSQNWTKSAETVNAENTLILSDNRDLARRFREEFNRLRALAGPECTN